MPYDLTITVKPEGRNIKVQIQELKEMKEWLEQFRNDNIEVELHKTPDKPEQKTK